MAKNVILKQSKQPFVAWTVQCEQMVLLFFQHVQFTGMKIGPMG